MKEIPSVDHDARAIGIQQCNTHTLQRSSRHSRVFARTRLQSFDTITDNIQARLDAITDNIRVSHLTYHLLAKQNPQKI